MFAITRKNPTIKIYFLAVYLSVGWPLATTADEGCEPAGDYGFVCGLVSPEDLVRVPGTDWLIASGMAAGGALYGVDASEKTWTTLYPSEAPDNRQDMALYGDCPGAPDTSAFVTHGLNLRPGADGYSTLYVVGHGAREAIEVFDVDATGDQPKLTWTGCIMTPDGMAANSVASSSDGSLLATIPLFTDVPISDALAGKNTGAVFSWSPGDSGFTQVEGTDLPYANGIEVAPDGSEFYVASSGLLNVIAFSNTNPAKRLRSTDTFGIIPDNLHLSEDGELLTAGLQLEDPVCGSVKRSEEFDLGAFASCPRAFSVLAVNPETMEVRTVTDGPKLAQFSNITMAVFVGDELWIGTFAGDRVAYTTLEAK